MFPTFKMGANDAQTSKFLSTLTDMQKSLDRLVMMYASSQKIELNDTNDFAYMNNSIFNQHVNIIDIYGCPNSYKIINDEFLAKAVIDFESITSVSLINEEDKIVWRKHVNNFLSRSPEKYISNTTIYFPLIKQILELQVENLEIIYNCYRDQTLEYVKILKYKHDKLDENNKKCLELFKKMVLKRNQSLKVLT